MINYIEEVNKNVNIEEGKKTLENILITIYLKGGISTKELARNSLLPIPLVAAIKKEFIKKRTGYSRPGNKAYNKGETFYRRRIRVQKNK